MNDDNLKKLSFEVLFNSVDQGIAVTEMIYDADGEIVDMIYRRTNEPFERIGGLHNVLDRSIFDVLSGVEGYWLERYKHVAKTGLSIREENYQKDVDRWFDCFFARVDEGGRYVVTLFNDITRRKCAEATLRESEERQAFLLKVSDAIRFLAEPAEIQSVALRLLAERLGLSRAAYWEIHADHDRARRAATYDGELPPLPQYTRISDFSADQLACYLEGRPFIVSDTETDERVSATREACRAIQVRAWVGVPIVKNGRLLTVLGVEKMTPHLWTDAEVGLLQEVAERTWAASERGHIESSLRKSEQQMRLVLEGIGEAFYVLDSDTRFLFFSRAAGELWQKSEEEVIGRRFLEVFPVGAGTEGYAAHERVMRTGVPEHMEVFSLATGKWLEADLSPTIDGGISVAVRDIDARKRAEAALRESESRLRQFGEASQDVLWIRDAQTLDWTYLTPAFENIYGVNVEEALKGDTFGNWLALIVPEDREYARSMIDLVRRGEALTFEYRVLRQSDGEIRWVRNTDFPISGTDGRIVSIGGIGQDVTATKAAEERLTTSEERLRNAVEIAKLGLWDWDVKTGVVSWSDEHFRTLGYDVNEVEPSYEAWVARVHPEDRAQTEAALAHARDEKHEYVREFRALHPDGSVRWLSARGRFFYDGSGDAIRMIGAMLDTTERREWEERQKVLVAELQHRTRNLMAVVTAATERTIESSRDLPDFRTRIRDRLDALARVQGLLSRLADTDRVAFNELIRSELEAMNSTGKSVTLEGPAGIRLRSSMVQTLAMALHELATNAVKYGALGQPEASLSVRWHMTSPDRKGRPRLLIEWIERGVRMPPVGNAPQGGGQGRELIEEALPYQLGAQTTFEMRPDGVHCTIIIPVSESNARES